MTRSIVLGTLALCFLLVSPSSAQFELKDACRHVDGMYNLGRVQRILPDPASPHNAFYTVSQTVVCHAMDPFPSGDPDVILNTIIHYRPVFTSADVGTGIRDIAVSATGAAAVISDTWYATHYDWFLYQGRQDSDWENSLPLRKDAKVWFRESASSEFYEIPEVTHAELGRIQDVWLNAQGDVLVAVSSRKVGTWKRNGRSWTTINVTPLSDLGITFFPSLDELRGVWGLDYRCRVKHLSAGDAGGYKFAPVGVSIRGNPHGKQVFIDANREVTNWMNGGCPWLPYKKPMDFGFLIVADVGEWEWRNPVFVEEKWCREPKPYHGHSTPGAVWSVAVSHLDPDLVWAFCRWKQGTAFARNQGDGWENIPHGLSTGCLTCREYAFFISPQDGNTVYEVFDGRHVRGLRLVGGRLKYISYGPSWNLYAYAHPDRALFMDVDGTRVLFRWQAWRWGRGGERPYEPYKNLWAGKKGVPILDRVGWQRTLDACVSPRHNVLGALHQDRHGKKGGLYIFALWEFRDGQVGRLIQTLEREVKSGEVFCDVDALDGDMLLFGSERFTLNWDSKPLIMRVDLSTMEFTEMTDEEFQSLPLRAPSGSGFVQDVEWDGTRNSSDWKPSFLGYRHYLEIEHGVVYFLQDWSAYWWNPDHPGTTFMEGRVRIGEDGKMPGKFNLKCGGTKEKPCLLRYGYGMIPEIVEISIPEPVAIGEMDPIPQTTLSNYPNPFSRETSLTFGLAEAGEVALEIYSVAGRQVARIHLGYTSAGAYTVGWDAAPVSPGVYMVRLLVDGHQAGKTHRLVRI